CPTARSAAWARSNSSSRSSSAAGPVPASVCIALRRSYGEGGSRRNGARGGRFSVYAHGNRPRARHDPGKISTITVPQMTHVPSGYRVAFLDWLGCACAGATERAPQAMRALGDDVGARVAFAGTAGHVLDYDDTLPDGIAHISAPCAPAALVLADEL